MNEQANIPKLRFPGFESFWDSVLLGAIATFSKGKGISKSDIIENGLNPCIRYGELYTTYSEVIDDVHSRTNIDLSNLVLSEENDVIIPASGETQIDIATASCVIRKGIALGGDLNIIKTPQNGIFLSYYLNNKKKLQIAGLSQGISVVHLYAAQLKLLDLNIPTLPEQQKIASFLSKVDEKLAQFKKKKELLEQYKKGMMQKIFSQEVRFKADNGEEFPDWEEKSLGEVSIRITKKNKENNLNVLTISAQLGLVSQLEYFNKSVSAKDLTGYYLLEKGDFAYNKSYSKGYPRGAIKSLNKYDKGVVSTLYICFVFMKNINHSFMEHYFESGVHNAELEQVAQEGARNHGLLNIGVNDFFNTRLQLPVLSEQTKIAKFLSAIDRKIDHTQTQIDKTEQWKKGLLQQMFA